MNGEHGDSGPCMSCGLCALPGPDQGLDPCLGLLPGVAQACCGHGQLEEAYVVIGGGPGQDCDRIENGVTLRGQQAHDFFALVAGAEERWDREHPWLSLSIHDSDAVMVRPYGQVFPVDVAEPQPVRPAAKPQSKRKRGVAKPTKKATA